MSKETHIEWCDSSLNLMMGCDGCELWNGTTVKHCYAGEMTNHYGGRAGWPTKFEIPKLFTERLDAALRWSDLTGKERPAKPWLNGMPRMIFLNDMGDTFTESLPLDWLAPLLPRMADSPHVFMILTKRGQRMQAFSELYKFPANFWPGVSVTTQSNDSRIISLLGVKGGATKWVSAEPLLGPVDFLSVSCPASFDPKHRVDVLRFGYWCKHPHIAAAPCAQIGERKGGFVNHSNMHDLYGSPIGLVIAGGESGTGARACGVGWIRSLVEQCKEARTPCFVKQLGSKPVMESETTHESVKRATQAGFDGMAVPVTSLVPGLVFSSPLKLRNNKGGDMAEWPEDLRVREFPQLAT